VTKIVIVVLIFVWYLRTMSGTKPHVTSI